MIQQGIALKETSQAHWLIFSKERLLSFSEHPALLTASWSELSFIHAYRDNLVQIGEHQSKPCYVLDLQSEQPDLEGIQSHSLRSFFMHNDEALFNIAARAWQVVHFRRTHQFCGQCGSRMHQVDWEMAMQCQRCQHRCYPRVSPCIIVAIRKGDKILLAQGKSQRQRAMFSTLAGFVESGESIEHAVHREVFEEVGVEVGNLEYFGSQPWPFPHSLMLGFLAEWKHGEIKVDGEEILEAHWFDVDNLPNVPPTLSISGQLIEETVKRIRQ